jgi:hypothetical protein
MVVDDVITGGEKIVDTLARLGSVSTGPPKRQQLTGELDYVYGIVNAKAQDARFQALKH